MIQNMCNINNKRAFMVHWYIQKAKHDPCGYVQCTSLRYSLTKTTLNNKFNIFYATQRRNSYSVALTIQHVE